MFCYLFFTFFQGSVYLKAQYLSPVELQGSDMNAGQLTNNISTDPANIQMFVMYSHLLWAAPIQVRLYINMGRKQIELS